MSQKASLSHTLTFISVYKQYRYFTAFVLVLACMSVFESPPHCSVRMDQDQTYNIGSPDLREEALDDMLHRIHLQSDDPGILEHDAERDQLRQQADSFIHAMESPIGISRRIGLNPVSNVDTYCTSTPSGQ